MYDIEDNIRRVRERIAEAADNCGRKPSEITLIAVTKTHPAEIIASAIEAGITDIGENRIQEAETKFSQLGLEEPSLKVKRHLAGHLQRNKVKKALQLFDIIHSVDSLRLAEAVSQSAAEYPEPVEILIEVNTSREESKFGLIPEETIETIEQISQLLNIKILGLMTVAGFSDDMKIVRPQFVELRKLSEKIDKMRFPNVEMRHLSMGMTNDFETAIEEGATMVRIGTAIFGERVTV
ncbi:YggS family pyridoxal phosphate-dependent enzyme [bacterium]|nr:YggS family pyridoxal phosphate-dependent enzyme [FCB group bacterium]MBL7190164.1 YggS family pyridoxal phosphate-dependent enzyme [bacterium]